MSKFGCIKDKFDDRDYLMRAYLPVIKLPKKKDWTSKMSPVRDQGEEGVCHSADTEILTRTGWKLFQRLIAKMS
jgi:hypothetical protein